MGACLNGIQEGSALSTCQSIHKELIIYYKHETVIKLSRVKINSVNFKGNYV